MNKIKLTRTLRQMEKDMTAFGQHKQRRLIEAEQAGCDYFRDHPCSDYATVEQVARNKFHIVLEREWFIAGWNKSFWDAQDRNFSEPAA